MKSDLRYAAEAMRHDWDERARRDALHYVYTRDSDSDEPDFDASGLANFNQLVRPYLPILLEGREPAKCRMVEIGCGVGRMTRCFAAAFREVVAVDVSAEMIALARQRVTAGNVVFQTGSGYDLGFLADASFDLAFSYIVFQHVPDRAAIQNYVRESHRVLKSGGVFKFQLNGDLSGAGDGPPDTWRGAAFSLDEASVMLESAGFSLLAAEGMGTQYFVLTARKGADGGCEGPRSYIFPGEGWALDQLLEGWGDAVDHSWRPLLPRSETLLAVPIGGGRFFAGLYCWPANPFPARRISVWLDDIPVGTAEIAAAGDHYLEFPTPAGLGSRARARLEIAGPENAAHPAVRCLGFYTPRR